MNKLFTLLTLLCTGCAIRQNGNPPPAKGFKNLDKNKDSVISLQEYNDIAAQSYDYLGPAIWIAVLLGTVFVIVATVSFISKK